MQYPAFGPNTLFFAPGSSKVAVGYFDLFCPEFAPTVHTQTYFWSHTVSLYFVPGDEVCPGGSIVAKGSQAPACLNAP